MLDGDTIGVHGIRIRLEGIDAPESRQTCRAGSIVVRCGRDAAFHLSNRIGRRPVSCEPRGTDRYGRTLAVCFEGGEDLNAFMVRNGQAVAYRAFSQRYVWGGRRGPRRPPGHLGNGVRDALGLAPAKLTQLAEPPPRPRIGRGGASFPGDQSIR